MAADDGGLPCHWADRMAVEEATTSFGLGTIQRIGGRATELASDFRCKEIIRWPLRGPPNQRSPISRAVSRPTVYLTCAVLPYVALQAGNPFQERLTLCTYYTYYGRCVQSA